MNVGTYSNVSDLTRKHHDVERTERLDDCGESAIYQRTRRRSLGGQWRPDRSGKYRAEISPLRLTKTSGASGAGTQVSDNRELGDGRQAERAKISKPQTRWLIGHDRIWPDRIWPEYDVCVGVQQR